MLEAEQPGKVSEVLELMVRQASRPSSPPMLAALHSGAREGPAPPSYPLLSFE